MNYQIADAKTKFFDDKQHYLNFLNAWKKAAQRSQKKGEDWACLTGAHMFFYAAVRGRNVYEAFTPIHKETKLRNGFHINQGMYFACDDLKRIGRWASQESEWAKSNVEKFLAPFDGTIDKERLVYIINSLPEVKPLYSNYGKGHLAAEALLAPEARRLIDAHLLSNRAMWKVIENAMEIQS